MGYFLYLRGERVEERGSESKSSGDFGVEIDGVCTTVIYSSILQSRKVVSVTKNQTGYDMYIC